MTGDLRDGVALRRRRIVHRPRRSGRRPGPDGAGVGLVVAERADGPAGADETERVDGR